MVTRGLLEAMVDIDDGPVGLKSINDESTTTPHGLDAHSMPSMQRWWVHARLESQGVSRTLISGWDKGTVAVNRKNPVRYTIG